MKLRRSYTQPGWIDVLYLTVKYLLFVPQLQCTASMSYFTSVVPGKEREITYLFRKLNRNKQQQQQQKQQDFLKSSLKVYKLVTRDTYC